MLIHRLALIAALVLPSVAVAAPDKDVPKLSDADVAVIAHVHAVDQTEIELGQLANKNGRSPSVKSYGDLLIKDHRAADKDLTALAKKHQLTPIPLDGAADNQAGKKEMMDMVAHLKTLKGDAFDHEFLAAMIDGHTKEIAKTETAISTVADPDLAKMLVKIKPVLQKHLDAATKAQNELKPSPKS